MKFCKDAQSLVSFSRCSSAKSSVGAWGDSGAGFVTATNCLRLPAGWVVPDAPLVSGAGEVGGAPAGASPKCRRRHGGGGRHRRWRLRARGGRAGSGAIVMQDAGWRAAAEHLGQGAAQHTRTTALTRRLRPLKFKSSHAFTRPSRSPAYLIRCCRSRIRCCRSRCAAIPAHHGAGFIVLQELSPHVRAGERYYGRSDRRCAPRRR